MKSDDAKRAAAQAALDFIPDGGIIGIGTGSTVDHFIDLLTDQRHRIEGAVSSSARSTDRLRAAGIEVLDLNSTGTVPVYVDGADEANPALQLVKGGGGALTQEKILAAAAASFVCIVDDSKLVEQLGAFPLPVEVIPMARSLVARRLVALGGAPAYRTGVMTDNGNVILDVHHLDLSDPERTERLLNDIPGVVCNGIFALRRADVLLCGHSTKGVSHSTNP